tara:strand:- start:40791 stop:41258 length:468 start_codon:yes stop_codon:yes gene_type:complete
VRQRADIAAFDQDPAVSHDFGQRPAIEPCDGRAAGQRFCRHQAEGFVPQGRDQRAPGLRDFPSQVFGAAVSVKFDSPVKERFYLGGEIGSILDRPENLHPCPRLARRLDRFGQPLVGDDAAHPCQIVARIARGHPAVGIDAVGDHLETGAPAIGP